MFSVFVVLYQYVNINKIQVKRLSTKLVSSQDSFSYEIIERFVDDVISELQRITNFVKNFIQKQ